MTLKRVLIATEDRLIGNFLREHLENYGFIVENSRSGDAALKAARDRPPDAVVVDAILPGRDAREVVAALREDSAEKPVPIVCLPVTRPPMAEPLMRAGANQLLVRSNNLPAELVDALQHALGRERTLLLGKTLPLKPDLSWSKMCAEGVPELLSRMRLTLHEAMRDPGDPAPIRNLLQEVHAFTEQMAIFGERPVFQYAAALESLVFELTRFPSQSNVSTVRTLGQAIDFISVLTSGSAMDHLKDPGTAQVLVVDDEDGARKIVMSAMSLVGLKSMAADAPSAALAALGTQPFDLVFLDVGMPEMNGFELCTRLRSIALHEKTPVVFVTGMASFQNRVQSSLSGANDLVGKPFSVPELGLKALTWVFKGQLGQL